ARDVRPAGQAMSEEPARTTAPRRNRGWIWYLVIVFALAAVATTTLIVFNLGQQLTPEQLEAARKRWQEKGPRDYELRYTTKIGTEPTIDRYVVVVRGGQVQSVTLNEVVRVPKAKFSYYGMPALFDQIEQFLEIDRQPGKPRTYARAVFSPEDGHLRGYKR